MPGTAGRAYPNRRQARRARLWCHPHLLRSVQLRRPLRSINFHRLLSVWRRPQAGRPCLQPAAETGLRVKPLSLPASAISHQASIPSRQASLVSVPRKPRRPTAELLLQKGALLIIPLGLNRTRVPRQQAHYHQRRARSSTQLLQSLILVQARRKTKDPALYHCSQARVPSYQATR